MKKINVTAKSINVGGSIFLYSTNSIAENFRYPSVFKAVFVNGSLPQLCEGDKDYFIAKEGDVITVETREQKKQVGYILTNKQVASEKIPLRVPLDQHAEDEDGNLDFKAPLNGIRGLYDIEEEAIPGEFFELIIERQVIASSDGVPVVLKPIAALLPTDSYGWTKEEKIASATSVHSYYYASIVQPRIGAVEGVVLPKVLRSEVPCSLSSVQVYGIVRKYIKENINGKYARITSDYDFCFTVQKVVPLNKPYTFQSSFNSGTKRRPRYAMIDVKEKLYTVFEMTNDKDNYKGYTPIGGISAESERDLNKQIDDYCSELIEAINAPLVECKHCGGYGFHIEKLPLINKQ